MTTKTVILAQPHEHAGVMYPAGKKLELPTADANWLMKEVPETKLAEPKAHEPEAKAVDHKAESKVDKA